MIVATVVTVFVLKYSVFFFFFIVLIYIFFSSSSYFLFFSFFVAIFFLLFNPSQTRMCDGRLFQYLKRTTIAAHAGVCIQIQYLQAGIKDISSSLDLPIPDRWEPRDKYWLLCHFSPTVQIRGTEMPPGVMTLPLPRVTIQLENSIIKIRDKRNIPEYIYVILYFEDQVFVTEILPHISHFYKHFDQL